MAVQQKQCFLKNINEPTKSILLNKNQLKIGRGRDMTVCLLSVMISKHHATINKKDNNWTITDENSMNGVFVNDNAILPLVPHPIYEGDSIQIGKSKDHPFSYVFQSRILTKQKEGKLKSPKISPPPCDKLHISKDNFLTSPTVSQKTLTISPAEISKLISSSDSASDPNQDIDCIVMGSSKRKRNLTKSPIWKDNHQKFLEYEKKLKEMQKRLKASEQALENEKKISSKQANVINNLNTKMEGTKKKLKEVQESQKLDKLLLEELHQKSEAALKEKEELLWRTMEEKKVSLEEEMKSIEMELRMRDIANQAELEDLLTSKKRLEQVLKNKEIEQRLLEQQLQEAKEASIKEKNSALKIKEDVLTNFAELMETELQCSVCSELFVRATTLNCSHSFCSFCIEEWIKRKRICPVCRTPITSQTRSIVLDSYIEKMVSCFSEEMKERRKQIISERKAAESKTLKTEKKCPGYMRPSETRGNSAAHPITLMGFDDDEDDWSYDALDDSLSNGSSSDDSSDSNVNGVSGSYFGGYGRCYLCGQRGHWANGCPFQ